MNLNFTNYVKQPFTGASWLVNLLLGAGITLAASVLVAIPVLGLVAYLLSAMFVGGYTLRLMKAIITAPANAAVDMPEFVDRPKELLKSGLWLTLGMMIWSIGIIAVVFGGIAAAGLLPVIFSGDPQVMMGALLILLPFLLLLGVIATPFFGILTAHYAATERFSALFSVRTVFRTMFARPLSTLIAIVATVVLGVVASMFAAIPVAGIVLGPLASFAAALMNCNLWAQVYKNAQ